MCYNKSIMIPRSDSTIATYRQHFKRQQAKKLNEREARRQQALAKLKAVAPAVAANIPSVQQLYLFGSVIRHGQFHQRSDVDMGVVGTTAEDYFELWRQLEAALPAWPIDLREISEDSFFADSVKRTGLLIYERTNQTVTS